MDQVVRVSMRLSSATDHSIEVPHLKLHYHLQPNSVASLRSMIRMQPMANELVISNFPHCVRLAMKLAVSVLLQSLNAMDQGLAMNDPKDPIRSAIKNHILDLFTQNLPQFHI